jgi:UDP-N-acetylmuramoylalanine--D-glutamate ligase
MHGSLHGTQGYKAPDKALVLGAGRSGAAAARLLRRLGVEPSLYDDQRPWDRKGQAALLTAAAALYGPGELPPLAGAFGQVVVSPGVPLSHPAIREALTLGIPVLGELELAWRNQSLPVVAVTGSNGKSTTTELATHILGKLGESPACAGNIGRPLSEVALEMLEAEDLGAAGPQGDPRRGDKPRARKAPALPYTCAVLEVSSFQLETIRDFHAKGAAFLNFSPDHLDRHGDMGAYFRLKCRVFANQTSQDTAVVNEDDAAIALKSLVARRFGFSRRKRPAYGAWTESRKGEIWIMAGDGNAVAGEAPWSAYGLVGTHNQENLMAAVGLAMSLGHGAQEALDAAEGFKMPEHRLEYVGSWNEVDWYDDSKGTNSGAVATALQNFPDGTVVLILGGRDKEMDFRPLKAPVRAKARHMIMIGEARGRLKSTLRGVAPMTSADSMEDAVAQAIAKAQPGDTVLLSPACASFDMFSGYKERGEVFQREARRQNENPSAYRKHRLPPTQSAIQAAMEAARPFRPAAEDGPFRRAEPADGDGDGDVRPAPPEWETTFRPFAGDAPEREAGHAPIARDHGAEAPELPSGERKRRRKSPGLHPKKARVAGGKSLALPPDGREPRGKAKEMAPDKRGARRKELALTPKKSRDSRGKAPALHGNKARDARGREGKRNGGTRG